MKKLKKKNSKKSVGRPVIFKKSVRVSLSLDETEKRELEKQSKNFNSVSDYVRHLIQKNKSII